MDEHGDSGMIINCGTRRLKSYQFGWMIQKREIDSKTGETRWREDRPAYPNGLAHACQMLLERELRDGGDCDIKQLPARLDAAYEAVLGYMDRARKAA